MVRQLYAAIRQLPKLDASLALMHLDGLSYREMSEVMGITESNVGVKLNRIRKQLAEMLKGTDHES
jgi:RNA polymerase sigma-70 factor (ECF subfamily)